MVLHVRKGMADRQRRIEPRLFHERFELVDGRETPVRIAEIRPLAAVHLLEILLCAVAGSGRLLMFASFSQIRPVFLSRTVPSPSRYTDR